MKMNYFILVLILVSMLSGCTTSINEDDVADQSNFYLFYPDSQANFWLVEEVVIENNLGAVIRYIIHSDKNLISSDVKLLDYTVKDEITYINLSSNYENFDIGDLGMLVNHYTLVNTICNNKFEEGDIKAVSFSLEGTEYTLNLQPNPIYPNAELQKLR